MDRIVFEELVHADEGTGNPRDHAVGDFCDSRKPTPPLDSPAAANRICGISTRRDGSTHEQNGTVLALGGNGLALPRIG